MTIAGDAWPGGVLAGQRRRWRTDDPRVAAVLWWYMGASVVLDPAAACLARTGRGLDLAPDALDPVLDGDGTLLSVRPPRPLPPGPEPLGRSIAGLAAVLEPLAAASGANLRALWAITADALAGRLLARAGDIEGPLLAAAAAAACPPLPTPRFTTVPAAAVAAARADLARLGLPAASSAGTDRVYVHRVSCCLIYRTPAADLCVSCPRQLPATRTRRLADHAASG